ncbi:hypothetical protein DOTSEDRAFT_58207 [Lecanosticta acicola]|uniref:Gfd2/YDR514C-like C-terminal domain-containing protein n=1 Tax=Lecanosticta acicola TaxID=111012 RepID=A0AAI9ECQ7_9PEZI|nr:hypothetical protein DOTSEDRAFT_58207 [Lecanosticta acicola]
MSRVDQLIALLGGPANLPPKLPRQSQETEPTANEGPDDDDDDDDIPPPVQRDPDLKRPTLLQPLFQPAPNSPAPMYTSDGESDFPLDGRKGQPAPLAIKFVPFIAVTKYCYKFVPKQRMQPLASAFFDADKIYNRDWELYYINSDYSGVLAFITESQLHSLIHQLNSAFPDANVEVEEDIVLDFEHLTNEYRPRWLGHCKSRAQYNSWIGQLQGEPAMVLPTSGDRSLEAFKAKMQAALDANKNKNKAMKAKKHQQALVTRQGMVKETLRAQRYLGLLPKKQDESQQQMPDITNLPMEPLDESRPCPHSFDSEPIFIAIDCEAWEKPPRPVTEIGVATLDTRDLKGIAPGLNGESWHQYIRGRHFRIIEYKNYTNSEYIQGCPDRFEFGDSEFVGNDSISSVLASCFREPFSKKDEAPSAEGEEPEKRNIVIVGHDLGQDITYCHNIGFSVLNRGNILDTVDTVNMHRAYSKDPNARSLGQVLSEFDLSGWHLHNAGNDAVYTLQAMLAIAVKSASQRGSQESERQHEEDVEKRTEAAVELARERMREDSEGWDSNSGEDGGVPLPKTEDDYRPKAKGAKLHGPQAPPMSSESGLYTIGGAPLDV